MDELIAGFSQSTGIAVEMTSSFDAFEKMDLGLADVVLAHYKKNDGRTSAQRFVMSGQGHWPRMVFANQMVIVGPRSDPASIHELPDAADAIRRISGAPLAARGRATGLLLLYRAAKSDSFLTER